MLIYKKILFLILLILPFNVYGENKIAYVDIDFVLTNINAGKIVFEKLENNEKLKREVFNDKEKKLKDEENKILASRNIISQEQLDINIKEFQNKLKDYRNYKSEELKKLNKIKNDEIVKLLNLINPLIQEYMKSNSINFLMDKKNIYIADKSYDLTNKLIEIINKKIK
tara:strand:- start:272 stop:778 length:507 start_codon:yes stop_codon:yes gene_type:complete